MSHIKPIKIILYFFLIFYSCTTIPIQSPRLHPSSTNTVWIDGKEYVLSTSNNLKVKVAFDRATNLGYRFIVGITNLGDTALIIDPTDIYCIIPKIINGVQHDYQLSTIDPESEIYKLKQIKDREKSRFYTKQATGGIITLFDFFADIATIGQAKTQEEVDAEEIEDLEREVSRLKEEKKFQTDQLKIDSYIEEWESTALRKTTLLPNNEINGFILFPITETCPDLNIYFPFQEKISFFHFINNQISLESTDPN